MYIALALKRKGFCAARRISKLPQQFPHVPCVIIVPELLSDDLTHQRTGPDPCFYSISSRPTIQNVAQPFSFLQDVPGRTAGIEREHGAHLQKPDRACWSRAQ